MWQPFPENLGLTGLPGNRMISPFEMATIYWSRIRMTSIYEVKALMRNLKSPTAQVYWGEVLIHLEVKKNGRQSLQ